MVYKVDRFARNTEDHFAVRRILLSHGTSLHSVTEPIGNRPAEKFIETVLAGASEYDSDAPSIADLNLEQVLAAASWLLPRLAAVWEPLAPESRARFERLVFPKGLRCNDDCTVRTSELGPIMVLSGAQVAIDSDKVDLGGIEPPTDPCHGSVLPLYYRP